MHAGEFKKAARIIDDDTTSPAQQDDQTFNIIKEMFPRRKRHDTPLPEADPTSTGLTHIDAMNIRKSIERIQGSGGISQLDAKQLRRIVNTQVFTHKAKKITSTLADICNNLASVPANEEATMPLRAVRIVALPKKLAEYAPSGSGKS